MQITFKLFATLMEYLPAAASKNSVTLEVGDAVTPNQLIDRFSVPRSQVHLVLVNGVYLAEADRDKPLREGDALAVWPPVAGG
ncbi:MAG: MoaD/ThiS family protein [Gammaproteobacteria bacterium]|nr:MoaD/ThiS family protein [Gammaproteobacteria bacterium]MDD9875622.1 MoaD/ThiS family protein [Gammaproteobacteria bacterium]